ncbi:phosphoribosyltransferase [Candidatus Falkowbacteria bacterium]|uniref:Phosphoribosyltransferase domain-containing protein n=1 Tax=Candidatus Buchananbacteria bacterium CG10_big_fil_rev_8_21_14_0_10_33_19 TaxID=1974525 RepID=A0A2H0W4R3_9BACT|nr:phosphoribosyltransferase [Candidatus Falkowbacteria bacterium]PIS06343.1 MAG: hypothetical protein COT80_02130 [Candidatus Buchananbacteria bacterium CG10_big_fil_rev_8_21_14_0_10_33_19]
MKNGEPGHELKKNKTYILTFDLAKKVKLFRSIGLKTPDVDAAIYTDIKDGIIRIVNDSFPGANVRAVTMEALADEILTTALDHRKHLKDAVVVSTCVEIAGLKRGQTIDINRLVNRSGNIIGLGPRPGYSGLKEQIRDITNSCRDNPIILMEDGTFTGGTLLEILGMFKECKAEVAAVVVGFAFSRAIEALQNQFDGEVIVIERMEEFIDWMPDHDFFPFISNCGRVIGVPWNGYNLPFYTYNHASYSVPYIYPFCPMPEWTSIPHKHAVELSRFCLQKDLEIFKTIEQMNGRRITIGDLDGVYPRVSIPICIGQPELPHLNACITDYLASVCHEIN